ncbi:MAG: putative DNA-binding domain-containing protein [Porticoccus sp.]|nr:putative DNA-binding domain-containing protein [Porticoccus sp.]
MPVNSFQQAQYDFAAHLRDPLVKPAPADVEDRRMKIYRDLIYNNIESFLSSGFPILHSILEDGHWHDMVRDFVSHHQSHTPYFLEISQEFLRYLQEEREAHSDDPAFMHELAHYEWVELALDVSTVEMPEASAQAGDLLSAVLAVSPLAWRLSYQYPVHNIGPEYRPDKPPEEASFLVVYRNRGNEVKFLEINAVTARLLQLIDEKQTSGRTLLLAMAEELQVDDTDTVINYGEEILTKLYSLDILI